MSLDYEEWLEEQAAKNALSAHSNDLDSATLAVPDHLDHHQPFACDDISTGTIAI